MHVVYLDCCGRLFVSSFVFNFQQVHTNAVVTAVSSNISKATRVPRANAALDVFMVEVGEVGMMERVCIGVQLMPRATTLFD